MKNINLISARKKRGLTQYELGKKVGVSKQTVSNWENCHSVPPMERAFKVALVLDSDVNFLFFNNNSQYSE